jgi:exopolysaccharide biosynthesis polyprenyl glycosylphosphotransferase
MSAESATTQLATDLAQPRPATRPRIGLHLTAAERKYLLLLVDLLLINGSLLVAVTAWRVFSPSLTTVAANAKWFLTLSILWIVVAGGFDVYNLARSASTTSIMVSAGLAALTSALVYLAIPTLTPIVPSRTYALVFVALTTASVVGWRMVYARVLVQPAFRRQALILGMGESAPSLIEALQQGGEAENANPFRGTGYRIIGLVTDGAADPGVRLGDLLLLGHTRHLVSLARRHGADEIVVALDENAISTETHQVLLDCRELGLQVSTLAEVYEKLAGRLQVDYARHDLRLILSPPDSPAARLYAGLKRLLDLSLALCGQFSLGLTLPWVALGNALFSPGPLFYRQQRVGQGGRPFALIKFRTMIPDAEKTTGAVWCDDDDPRVTPVGRLLRKTRLDELPQFLNVLKGEMSIVGPRPERPHFVGQLSRALPLYRARHAVKPGITGWAQVRYGYGSSVEDGRIKLEYDLFYVKHASLFMDLLILLHTVRVVLGMRGQ